MNSQPAPDEIAALLQVEHLLDQRWPETKIEPSLTRISALLDMLGSPQRSYPAIHITGTNGKTSVARIADSLLTALHRRTGRTASPHLQSVVERIAIDGAPISPARYVDLYREIEPFVQMVDERSQAGELGEPGPAMSKFEVLTAMAFAAFADAPVDVAVVEVGLGGRWDATNVINAPVAVITPISLDHAEYLGDDIAGIAAEKAGIITRQADAVVPIDTVAVIGRQQPEAMEPLLAQAARADAAVAREDSEFAVLDRRGRRRRAAVDVARPRRGVQRYVFCRCTASTRPTTRPSRWPLSRRFFGAGVQRQLDVDAVRAGFAAAVSPGRLERVRTAPTVLIDAAHNPAGAAALAQALNSDFDFRHLVGVVAVLTDKDAVGILAALEPAFDQVVITHNGSPRGLDVEVLAAEAGPNLRPGPGGHCGRDAGCDRVGHRADRRGCCGERVGHRSRDHRICGHGGRSANAIREGPAVTQPDGAGPDDPSSTGPGASDPWKSFRGVMAGTLILEAVVVLLVLAVVAKVPGALTVVSGVYVVGLAVALIALAGVQGRPWSIWINLGAQLAVIAGVVFHPSMAFVGAIFAGVWVLIAYLRADVLRRQRLGLLPGQQRPSG